MAKRRPPRPGPHGTGQGAGAVRVSHADTAAAGYTDLVVVFTTGLEALQAGQLEAAHTAFETVLRECRGDLELAERARTFLAIVARRRASAMPLDGSVADRLLAATMALNAGDSERAHALLERLVAEAPTADQAHYMLAVVHADKGRMDAAVAALTTAVALNPENRRLARRDPDLRALRAHPPATALLGSSTG